MVNVAEKLIDGEDAQKQGAGLNFCNGFCFGVGLWLAGLVVMAVAALLTEECSVCPTASLWTFSSPRDPSVSGESTPAARTASGIQQRRGGER